MDGWPASLAYHPAGRRWWPTLPISSTAFARVADGEKEYLQGVIEFYQTVLTINAALVGQAQNVEVKRLTEASYAQNEEIKKISAWAAIFFAPTLIGTVYGMNFDHMPELHWAFGYPLALILMLLLSVALYVMFKRRQWLFKPPRVLATLPEAVFDRDCSTLQVRRPGGGGN